MTAAYFQDGVPLVGFCAERSPTAIQGLRQRLWNYGRVPLLINAHADSVSAYNGFNISRRPTSIDDALESGRREDVAEGLLAAFNRHEIESGGWSRTYASKFSRADRVDRVLLRNLRVLRNAIPIDEEIRRDALDAFIGGALTASYLADRGVLDVEHLDELAGSAHLNEILESGLQGATRLFRGLADHFNGDVFGSVPAALDELDDTHVHAVSALLRGDDLATGQFSLWPYDFSVLPGELVSSVYEQLLESNRQQDAAYYTPRFLVDLMLDEVLPWDSLARTTIADLSCGSGAFLSEAFRRLAFQQARAAGRPFTFDQLKSLMTECIFGVDVNIAAARVAAFGLYLALLDGLDPPRFGPQRFSRRSWAGISS